MKSRNQQLRQEIIRIAEQDKSTEFDFSVLEKYRGRPAFLAAPMSYAGIMYGEKVSGILDRVVAAIDDQALHQDNIHGAPRWSSRDFLDKASQYPDAIVIDFSCSPRGNAFVDGFCESSGVEKISIARSAEILIPGYEDRPVFILSGRSPMVATHGAGIAAHAGNVVAAVDDDLPDSSVPGVPGWSREKFLREIGNYSRALAIDFSVHPGERGRNRKLCALAGVEMVDSTLAFAHCGLHAVYEPVRSYRQRTLARIDDFLRVADRLDDDFSVFTLYSNILYRLTYKHDYLEPIWATPFNEYFSWFGDASTFQLGQREHFCDCGAYQGPVVKRFLDATGYRYESITAFEPDGINYDELSGISSPLTPNFRAVKKAVSNKSEDLYFQQTGTMGSHVTPRGDICISATRLDDELENLTFLKMDIEGFEVKALEGASRLISTQRPRMAICVYHYAQDLLDVMAQLDKLVDGYHFRLRQHSCFAYYDLVLYASPVAGTAPPPWAQ